MEVHKSNLSTYKLSTRSNAQESSTKGNRANSVAGQRYGGPARNAIGQELRGFHGGPVLRGRGDGHARAHGPSVPRGRRRASTPSRAGPSGDGSRWSRRPSCRSTPWPPRPWSSSMRLSERSPPGDLDLPPWRRGIPLDSTRPHPWPGSSPWTWPWSGSAVSTGPWISGFRRGRSASRSPSGSTREELAERLRRGLARVAWRWRTSTTPANWSSRGPRPRWTRP